MVAGVIWIAVGTGIIGNFVLLLAGSAMEHDMGGGTGLPHTLRLVVAGLFHGVVAGFFLNEGACLCRGTVPSTLGLALGSVLFAAVFVGMAVFPPELRTGLQAILAWLIAAGLVGAGTLAFLGRVAYDAWWKNQRRPLSE
jgi:hypothetical protein